MAQKIRKPIVKRIELILVQVLFIYNQRLIIRLLQ